MNKNENDFKDILSLLMDDTSKTKSSPRENEKKINLHKDHRKRVKKRFLDYGFESFSDHQVLEAALFYALPHVDTNEIAHELINLAGSFTKVFDLSIEELMSINGIKENAASFIKFLPLFCKFYDEKCLLESSKPGINYHDIGKIFVNSFVGEKREVIIACYFDETMNLIEKKILNKGTLTDVSLGYRPLIDDIYKYHIKYIAIAHNHPTFSPNASMEDIARTRALEAFLKKMQVILVEHYVVTGNQYTGILKYDEEHKISFRK